MIRLYKKGWEAEILPFCGMNTIRLVIDGEEILRSPRSLAEIEAGSCAYGIPLLLPPNRTRDGEFIFEGKKYQLPINETRLHNHLHGSLHLAKFYVTEQREDCVTAVYDNVGEVYPFPFRIRVCYWLDHSGYCQRFEIQNTGAGAMPLTFGLHTTFLDKGWLRIPIKERWERDERYIPTGELKNLSETERMWKGGSISHGIISGYYTSDSCRAEVGTVQYKVSENFDQWILWNGDGKCSFISIEPLCGAVNCLNSGKGLKILQPGEWEKFDTKIHKMKYAI